MTWNRGAQKYVEQYVVCKNPKCRPHGSDRVLSWRAKSHGRELCKFCQTPFEGCINIRDSEWQQQGRKGRVRGAKADNDVSWGEKAGKGKGQGGSGRGSSFDDASFEAAFKVRFADRPDLIIEHFPPKPKTRAEELTEAFSAVETASAAHEHAVKVGCDMDAKFVRMQEELIEYANRVQECHRKQAVAKTALDQAQKNLMELRAGEADASVAQTQGAQALPTQAALKQIPELVASFDPTAGISRALSGVPVIQTISHNEAADVGRAMSLAFKFQLDELASKIVTALSGENVTATALVQRQEHPPNVVGTQQGAPFTSAPASSPPPPAPAAAGLGVDGDAVGDMKMADSTGKRSAAEMDDDKEPEMGDEGQAAGHHRIEAQQTIDRAKLAVTQASGSKGKGVGGRSPP